MKEKLWQSSPELRERFQEISKVSHRSYTRTARAAQQPCRSIQPWGSG